MLLLPAVSGLNVALQAQEEVRSHMLVPCRRGPAERRPSLLHSSLKANLTITFLPAQLCLALISQPMCGSTLIRRQKWISPLLPTEEDLKHLLKASVSLSDVTPQLPSPLSVESFCLITDTLLGLPVTLVSSALPALKLLSVSTPSTVALSESLCHSGHECEASGLKLALQATASPIQIHSGPPICLALDRGHLLKAIVGNRHMLCQKGPKRAVVVPCICLRVCSTVCGCAIVYVCLWHELREAAAGLGPSQGLCSGAVRKQARCETPTLPWRSGRNALLQQGLDTGSTHSPSPRGTRRISREEAVTDEVRSLLPDFRNCLPCCLWCLIDCTLHETRSADDTVSC
ncbi:hypothetical protein G5714_015366 [Onychostoma macrolepis]|uniref:Uncharacterized protein n=1 Tax=Onychostoma macrolepis TaxID=369639 RepID=A0A7J6CAP4_9TELE|nr:hypothetical protein G5714_015366 [Onychostoma macrolepis]